MASKASPTAIGAFVVGGIALIVAGLLVFGSGKFFQERKNFVSHFPGSVQGLRVGAPVTFRGAQIGQVTDIKIVYKDSVEDLRIPVIFEILPERFVTEGEADDYDEVDDQDELQQLIDQGLRAQLHTQSMVTGLLYVDLRFDPDTPVNLVGTIGKNLLEIPAIPSSLEEIQQTVGSVLADVPALTQKLGQLLTTIDAELNASKGNVEQLVDDLAEIVGRVRARGDDVDRIIADGAVVADKLRHTATTLDGLVTENQDQITGLIGAAIEAVGAVQRMADQINNAVAENRQGLQDFTNVGLYEWTGLAQDAQAAVAQFQRVGEELERNPTRFLFGGGGQSSGMRPEE